MTTVSRGRSGAPRASSAGSFASRDASHRRPVDVQWAWARSLSLIGGRFWPAGRPGRGRPSAASPPALASGPRDQAAQDRCPLPSPEQVRRGLHADGRVRSPADRFTSPRALHRVARGRVRASRPSGTRLRRLHHRPMAGARTSGSTIWTGRSAVGQGRHVLPALAARPRQAASIGPLVYGGTAPSLSVSGDRPGRA